MSWRSTDRPPAGCSALTASYHLPDRYHSHVPPGLNVLNNFLSIASSFKNFNLILSNNISEIKVLGCVCSKDQCLFHKNDSPFLPCGRTLVSLPGHWDALNKNLLSWLLFWLSVVL